MLSCFCHHLIKKYPYITGTVSKFRHNPKSHQPTVFKTLFSTYNLPMTQRLGPQCGFSEKPGGSPNSIRKNNAPNIFVYPEMWKRLAIISFGNSAGVRTLMCLQNMVIYIITEYVNLVEMTVFTRRVTLIKQCFIIVINSIHQFQQCSVLKKLSIKPKP